MALANALPVSDEVVLNGLIEEEERRFCERMPRSQWLRREARGVLAGGVASSWQAAPPQAVWLSHGRGSKVYDVDGNDYVDLHNGFGAMLVGHANPAIVRAVQDRVEIGTHFAQPTGDAIVVARELAWRFHLPLWRFCNSGTEATMSAIHLMRIATGRERILKVEGTYHGHHDAVEVSVYPDLEAAGPAGRPVSVRDHEGVPSEVARLTVVVPFGDLEAVERVFLEYPDEIAGMILEPTMMNIGIIEPPDGYLADLRALCHRYGAYLAFDEVKTGFAVAPGGMIERSGVVPDVVCLAKALGGGLPCGAIGGTHEIMRLIEDGRYEQVGTFNGNPLTMAAARATLLEVLTPDGYAWIDTLRAATARGAHDVLDRYRIPGYVKALGAKGCVVFHGAPLRDYRDFVGYDGRWGYGHWLVQHNGGVFLPPWGKCEQWTLSVQHTLDDVERFVANLETFAKSVRGARQPRLRKDIPMAPPAIADVFGEVGLPAPISELAARDWDAIVVGGGHNGLTAAAYLARAGKSVLVLEARSRLGGACTLERPFDDRGYVVSPCAYVVGLLDTRVVDELELRKYGYNVFVADPGIWCPFDDGTSYVQFLDHERTVANLRANGFSEAEIKGQFEYEDFFDSMRRALREGARDAWEGDAPSREELEALLGHDPDMVDALFDTSIADVIGRFCRDERMQTALYGQGVIGAWAGPRDPGTASIKLMHFSGVLEGVPMAWGYVEGGMGRISFAIAEAARAAGAVLVAGVPVGEILPGEGVRLAGGELVRAPVVVSNADPKVTTLLLGSATPRALREKVDGWRVQSPVLKVNCGLGRLPTWTAAPGEDYPCKAPVSIALPLDEAQAAFEACTRGVPSPGFAELYFQSAYDPTVAPNGKHTMSAFVQYAPYTLDSGDWDTRRDEIGTKVIELIGRFSPDIGDCVEEIDVLGPPDIEQRVGLTGGHIFQGECTPDQMWTARFAPRTGADGVYLCGAATHPAGSVIALNGRNAAMAVLADLAGRAGSLHGSRSEEVTVIPTSYLIASAELREAGAKGQGVFATATIKAGTTVAGFGGSVAHRRDFEQLDEHDRTHSIQIDDDLFLVCENELGPADYMNHSCEPNAGIVGSILIIVMRDLAPGEEICFDYAMCDADDYDEFVCACGTERCRGVVTGADWMRPELQARYAGYFSAYIVLRIAAAAVNPSGTQST